MDDGISAWVAGTRIALGSRKGTSAASLIVEAFGDAVLPQIPEAIGRAILRTEAALNLVLGSASTHDAATTAGSASTTDSESISADNAATDDRGGAS
ncbi:hypothetical protein LO749_21370 (plasmid) [Paracoccus denitrificans]|uniref:hypothetical protein n=1 Tax=Paracoccus denitrificans TaxID=266 RepID=UPI001E3392D0|nr:hypothetical protein [Paracoccus denitrificans]UFS68201.1 hypothetical protein LO749_21370 [Paracoccus denitrificans]